MLHSLRSSPDRVYRCWVLVSVIAVLYIGRLLLWLLPTSWLLRSSTARKAYRQPDRYYELIVQTIGWVGGRLKFTCLEQALGGKWLLRQYQYVHLYIGVQVTKGGAFEAHAWLTIGQNTVLGAGQQASFTTILVLE